MLNYIKLLFFVKQLSGFNKQFSQIHCVNINKTILVLLISLTKLDRRI